MPIYEPTVPTRFTLPLVEYLRKEQPHWLEAALIDAGIDDTLLNNPDASLGIDQFDMLYSAASRMSGRSDLGFQLGQCITLERHGALRHAAAQCSSLDQLLRLASKYSRLITPSFALEYRRGSEHGELLWRPAAGMSVATMHAFHEIHVVSLSVILKQVLGERLLPYDSYLSMAEPEHAAQYRGLRPLRVHFSPAPLPQACTVFAGNLLDMPLRGSSSDDEALTRELSRMQGRVGKASRWSDWIQLMLQEAEGCQPTLAQMAELASMSRHTLARYLNNEGCDYRALANAMRQQRACVMLRERQPSISQIAYRLGYADVANFSNAFRRQHGVSPRQYRKTFF